MIKTFTAEKVIFPRILDLAHNNIEIALGCKIRHFYECLYTYINIFITKSYEKIKVEKRRYSQKMLCIKLTIDAKTDEQIGFSLL